MIVVWGVDVRMASDCTHDSVRLHTAIVLQCLCVCSYLNPLAGIALSFVFLHTRLNLSDPELPVSSEP